jgi:hypothetical protein
VKKSFFGGVRERERERERARERERVTARGREIGREIKETGGKK